MISRSLCAAMLAVACLACTVSADGGSVAIATLNVREFGWGGTDCKEEADLETLARILAAADLICLQEVYRLSAHGEECYACSGDRCHLDALIEKLEGLTGVDWEDHGSGPWHTWNRSEYYIFLHRTDRVEYVAESMQTAGSLLGEGFFEIRPPRVRPLSGRGFRLLCHQLPRSLARVDRFDCGRGLEARRASRALARGPGQRKGPHTGGGLQPRRTRVLLQGIVRLHRARP